MAMKGGATLRPTIRKDQSQAGDLLGRLDFLQKAIQYGDVEKSKEIVAGLARQKANLDVQEKAEKLNTACEEEMSVKIYIEDKDLSGTHMTLKLKPSTKIRELKSMMQTKHGFPLEIQKWIVGKKIVKDEDTLHRLRVQPGSAMFLYLLSPQSIGLTKETYARKLNQQLSEESNIAPRTPGSRTSSRSSLTPSVEHTSWPTRRTMPNESRRSQFIEINENLDELTPDYLDPVPLQNAPPPPRLQKPDILNFSDVGWECPQCTYRNEPTRPGCEMCSADRPTDYKLPESLQYRMTEKEQHRLARELEDENHAKELRKQEEDENARLRTANFDSIYARMLNESVIENVEEFECPVCFDTVAAGDGVTLRECLHQFCRICLQSQIIASEEAVIKCPFQDDTYSCPSFLLDCEVKALIPANEYDKFLHRSLVQAESQAANSFHCKTIDCTGWCVYDDDVNFFDCMVCLKKNCLTCKAIHEGQNCKEFQEDINTKAQNDDDAKKTQEALQEMLRSGDAMECPQCKVVISKKQGCDWLRCTMCKTEICWCTKGRRWGPSGTGDTSGGCKCNVNGAKCHPQCQNCH